MHGCHFRDAEKTGESMATKRLLLLEALLAKERLLKRTALPMKWVTRNCCVMRWCWKYWINSFVRQGYATCKQCASRLRRAFHVSVQGFPLRMLRRGCSKKVACRPVEVGAWLWSIFSSLVSYTETGELAASNGHVQPPHCVMVPNAIFHVAINDRPGVRVAARKYVLHVSMC